MKVICDRGALVEALNLAGQVALQRTPKPILQCVKLEATGGKLIVAGTDLEVAVHMIVEQVEITEEGQAVLPAEKLASIVRESADETITLETEEEHTHVRGSDSHFKVFGSPPGDFPPVEPFTGEADMEINAGQLHDLITKTEFATARENSRYAINGVLIEREAKKLAMVATDGRRLAMARGAVSGPGEAFNAIIPTKALKLLARLFDDPTESVRAALADNQARFATDRATLTTNLVEGNFPPYRDVIPRDQDRKAVFKTDLLASGVRRAALLTNEESKGVRMAFSAEQLQLTSRAPEMGEAEVNVPIESYSGDPVEIGFNPTFVVDALKIIDSDTVSIELKAPNKPGLLKTGPEFTYVVMPVSLG